MSCRPDRMCALGGVLVLALLAGCPAAEPPPETRNMPVQQAPPPDQGRHPKPPKAQPPAQSPVLKGQAGLLPAVAGPQLDVAELLPLASLEGRCSLKKGKLTVVPLEGQPASAHYGSLRVSSDQGLGLALQVWRFGEPQGATTRFASLEAQLVGTQKTKEVGSHSLRAQLSGVEYLAFLSSSGLAVALLAVDQGRCQEQDLTAIARELDQRLAP